MKRSGSSRAMLALLAAGVLAGAGVAVGSAGSARPPAPSDPPPPPGTPSLSASVAPRPVGQPLPPGFAGLSLEYSAVEPYAGSRATGLDPVLVQLIRNLTPGHSPVLRIGGNSADRTWWPQRGETPPRHAGYALGPEWLRTTGRLAVALDARMILDLNLAGGRPAVAAAEATAFRRGIGPRYIEAFEIGNEPDVYAVFPWYRNVYARPRGYSLSEYLAQFSRWAAALGGGTPLAGPAYATLAWLPHLGRLLRAEPGLGVVTVHRYPLRACLTNPSAPGYPTVASLLGDAASRGLAQQVARYVTIAHAHGVPFRLDELNSASCSGKWGVSNTFASALWILDTLFNLARVGVDGVNIHTFPGAAYAPFGLTHTRRGWNASVAPAYYGMLLFTQAFPSGARRLPVVSPRAPVEVWATEGPGSATRVLVINKSLTRRYQVRLHVPTLNGPAHLERLRAPSPSATGGVTLGGRTFGRTTATGRLRPPRAQLIGPRRGVYPVTVPAASAVLLSS